MTVPTQTEEALTTEDEKIDHSTGADPQVTAAPPVPKRSRAVKLLVLFALLAAMGVGAKQLWAYFDSYESTDDAQIEGHLNGSAHGLAEQ